VLKRAFEPYVTTKSKGTGLGLAVVKKIADEHRASVRIANLQAGDGPEDAVLGARVSLSFSAFVAAPKRADGGRGAESLPPSADGPAPGPSASNGETTQAH
jgi:signal transduction histidine kinase